MEKRIGNLYSEIMYVVADAEGKPDSRFQHWVKRVDAVDQNKTNGYAFDGGFVNDGTVEIEVKPTVYLTKTVRGSRKYQSATYNVIVMDAAGELSVTDIRTTGERGWALRIRDAVAELVAQMSNIAPEPEVTVTLAASAAEILARLRERDAVLTDAEIITAALNVYEMHIEEAK